MNNHPQKICPKCKENARALNAPYCNDCRNEYQRQYIKNNKEKLKKQWKDNYEKNKKNPEYKKRNSESRSRRRQEIKKHEPEYYKELQQKAWEQKRRERKNKPWIRAKRAARGRIWKVKDAQGIPQYEKDLSMGCNINEFKEYIESLWQNGMNWENYGRSCGQEQYWELDHIKPMKSFDLWNYEDALECYHYTNLQPLWIKDHREKTKED